MIGRDYHWEGSSQGMGFAKEGCLHVRTRSMINEHKQRSKDKTDDVVLGVCDSGVGSKIDCQCLAMF